MITVIVLICLACFAVPFFWYWSPPGSINEG